jgi:hypothetical protein
MSSSLETEAGDASETLIYTLPRQTAGSSVTPLPLRWKQQVPQKRWYISIKLHAVISHNTVIFIGTLTSQSLIRPIIYGDKKGQINLSEIQVRDVKESYQVRTSLCH